jgi:Na+/H+ antiporter NhaD/arsenite permease-like protein
MNVSRFIWGIICLAIAALLTVLNFTLPPEKLMFNISGENLPLLPPIILGILGLVLLVSAFTSRGVQEEVDKVEKVRDPEKSALNKRLETIGWGFFLVMLGGFILVPGDQIPKGLWSIGVGLIMLGLNGARYYYGIRMSGFTTFLGIVSVISGFLQIAGLDTLGGAIFLIVLGAYLLFKPWFDKRQLFGKAEESRN